MGIQLCVLLWARPGAAAALVDYEDTVLPWLCEHGARVVQRARTDGADGVPTEIQIFEFPSEAEYEAALADERRTALAGQRDAAIARTDIYPVRLVETD